jgi:tetratricopeptide (TPR) repeat protein
MAAHKLCKRIRAILGISKKAKSAYANRSMAPNGEAKGAQSVSPINNSINWRILQAQLAELAAGASALECLLENKSVDDESIRNRWQDVSSRYGIALKASRDFSNYYTHSVLRNHSYAAFRMYAKGGPSQDSYNSEFGRSIFASTDEFLRSTLSEEDIIAQGESADLFHEYVNALCCFYCNRLLNLADNGNRPEGVEGVESQSVAYRHHKNLEHAGYFDEIYVIRISMIYTCISLFGDLIIDEQLGLAFGARAFRMLEEMDDLGLTEGQHHSFPWTAMQLWGRGVEASDEGDYRTAIEIFLKALEQDPNNPYVLNSTAFAYHAIGENQTALDYSNQAIAASPDDGLILKNKGMILISLSEHELALEALDRAMRVSPDLWTAAFYCSRANEELGHADEAINCLTAYLQKHPDCSPILEQRARVYWRNNDSQLALADALAAIKADPSSARCNLLAGHIYDSLSEHEEGIRYYTQAIENDSDNAEAYFCRAKNYSSLDGEANLKLAVRDLDAASRLDPEDIQIIGWRSQVKADLNDYEGAYADCDLIESLGRSIGIDSTDYANFQRRFVDDKKRTDER